VTREVERRAADIERDGRERLEHFTDAENARRFAADHRDDVHYNHAWHRWLIWDGARWADDETGEIVRRAKATVRGYFAEAAYTDDHDEDYRRRLVKHGSQSESEPRLRAMITLAQSEPGIPVKPEQLDADPWALNFLNGTLDLRQGGDLRPHRRTDLITKLVPVNYKPDARAPRFLSFLDEIFDRQADVIGFVQRALGYGLTGLTIEQALFLLWGGGANGKTTLLRIFMLLLGAYAQSARAETLMEKRHDTIPNDIARLKGARFVGVVEAENGHRFAEGLVKQLTGGDIVTARFMRAEYFDFIPTFKVYLASNRKPIIRGTDHAIWRRIRLIPFMVTIAEEAQDKELAEKLAAEGEGILAWAVEGCRRWQADGLGLPDAVKKATQAYREEMDVLGQFIADRCLEWPTAAVSKHMLYEIYRKWCADNGMQPKTQPAFSRLVKERPGITDDRVGHGRIHFWQGIGLADADAGGR